MIASLHDLLMTCHHRVKFTLHSCYILRYPLPGEWLGGMAAVFVDSIIDGEKRMDFRTTMTTPAMRTAGLTALLVTTLLSLYGCNRTSADGKAADAAAPMAVRQKDNIVIPAKSPLRERLQVAAVEAASATHTISLPAVVEADPAQTVNILPPLTGRLTELKVKLGDTVHQGQVLATISSPDLAQAYADADKAHDALDLANRALQRARGVHEAGANAGKDLEQAQSNVAQAVAEAARADSRLKSLGVDGAGKSHGLTLTAPVSGTVTALNSGTGTYLNDPTAALMTISNLEQVWVTANVPENLVALVAKGQAAEVRLNSEPSQVRHGAITTVSAVLEADSHRNKARIAFANHDGKLKPNMYASVNLSVPQALGVRVPASALLMNNDSTTVFVEVAPWTFVRRAVETGMEDGDMVTIVSGLRGGERVVVRGGVLLND